MAVDVRLEEVKTVGVVEGVGVEVVDGQLDPTRAQLVPVVDSLVEYH